MSSNGGSPQVGGYSFYLNVVVINSNSSAGGDNNAQSSSSRTESGSSTGGGDELREESTAPPPSQPTTEESLDESSADEPALAPPEAAAETTTNNGGGEIVAVGGVRTDDPKVKLLTDSKALTDFAFGRVWAQKFRNNDAGGGGGGGVGGGKTKDGRGFMSSIGSSISKSSSSISKRASRFVASKTMVSRAEKAVGECIPLVTEEIGVEMSISKRFQQGPVFVLEVDMKGCELLDLLKKVMGIAAAKHYACIKDGLEALGLPDAKEAFLKEILPKVRKAMMEKMSEIVPEKMKQKKAYADLEIQCVALEDAEEAKWLYNFLAFMEEMK